MTALLGRNETLVAGVILAFCLVGAFADPNFLSIPTLMALLRAGIVLGILAVGVLVVLGPDISSAGGALGLLLGLVSLASLSLEPIRPTLWWSWM